MKTFFVAFAALWTFFPTFAQETADPGQSWDHSPPATAESPFLYYRLPESIDANPLTIQFLVEVNGEAYVLDRLTVKDLSGGEAVEFLGRNPALLSELRELAGKGGDVEVKVAMEGFRESVSLADLAAASHRLIYSAEFQPVNSVAWKDRLFPSAETLLAAKKPQRNASICEDECYDTYASCAAIYCLPPIFPCGPCEGAYADCLENCCEYQLEFYIKTTLISTVYVSTSCLSADYPCLTNGSTYETWRKNYKDETIKKITYQDCSITEVVTSTSTYSKLCDVNVGPACSTPVGVPSCTW